MQHLGSCVKDIHILILLIATDISQYSFIKNRTKETNPIRQLTIDNQRIFFILRPYKAINKLNYIKLLRGRYSS